jgi:aspartate aminotransferase
VRWQAQCENARVETSSATTAGLARSIQAVPHSRIRELAEMAFRMEGVLKLYFGESNQPTPAYIKNAAANALQAGYTFYTENAGLLSLREALADYYVRMQGVTLDPRREIVITASGVQARAGSGG